MDFGPRWDGPPENSHAEAPGSLVEPRSGIEAALLWARAIGVRTGPTAAPRCAALVPLVCRWLAAQGYGVEVAREHVGHAFRVFGCRPGRGDVGVLGYRVPRELAEAWWAEVGGRPKRPRKKGPRKPRQRKVPPLFHPVGYTARPVVDTLGRVYPTVGVAAAMVANLHGAGNHKALHNALKASRDGRAEWGSWRGLLWRYLTEAEVAAVPFGTRCGEVPPGWGFGLLAARQAAASVDGVGEESLGEGLVPLSEDGASVSSGILCREEMAGGLNQLVAQLASATEAGLQQRDSGGQTVVECVDSGLGVVAHSLPLWCDGGGV